MASELGGSQITNLMETLPGIASVLRSPVADAMLNLIRAAARLRDFQFADADELVKYATRRGLLGNDEGERVLAEVREAEQKRVERAAERSVKQAARKAAVAAAKPKVAKPAPKPRPAPKAKAAKPAKKR